MRCTPGFMLLFALSACAAPSGGGCQAVRVADVPFTTENGRLLVAVWLNGQPARLAFDTGSSTSVLSRAAADRLHLRLVRSYNGELRGIGGQRPTGAVEADEVRIGDLHGADFPFLRADIFADAAGAPDGVLSADLMQAYDIDLDLPEHKIILYSTLGGCGGHPAVALDPPLYSTPLITPFASDITNPTATNPVVVPIVTASVNGASLQAVIDTGTNHTAIFRDAAGAAGMTDPSLFDDSSPTATGSGTRRVRVAVRHLAQIGLGDITINNLPVAVIDQHRVGTAGMLLGLDFLARVHVWISHSSNTLVLQYPPLPSPRAVGSP
jgi:clan AA aspartic protease (TIGR02281 family)